MWRAASVVVVAACGFDRGTVVRVDAGQPARVDARPDAFFSTCTLVAEGIPMFAGSIGGASTNDRPDLTCAGTGFPIGFDFQVQDDKEIIELNTRCATFARTRDGAMVTTPAERVGDPGRHGVCVFGDTVVPEQTCPPGNVLVGITANYLGSENYDSFAMHCQPVTADARIEGAITTVAFAATGTSTTSSQTVLCPPNTAIVSFGLRSGCTQDELSVRCVAVACP